MKYTTIKGTTIAGDVPCETDGWVRKSDLRKLVKEWRNGPPYPRDPDKLAIWQGECNCADELDKLLEG